MSGAGAGVVVIGGSAGSLDALIALLAGLPAGFGVPIVVVVHLRRSQPSAIAQVLASRCRLIVHEAQDKDPVRAGNVYVAPPGYHLLLDDGPALALSVEDPVGFSIPSIDVLFESAVPIYGSRVAGIVLSGANDDGAAGLRAICEAGGVGLVQAFAEAAAAAMPEAAAQACPRAKVLPLADIQRFLLQLDARHP